MRDAIPTTRPSVSGRVKPIWMNAKALAKVKKKHQAWKIYKRTQEGKDYQEYVRARNQARGATRQAVRDFEKLVAKNVKENPKAFWKYAKSKTQTRTGIADLRKPDGELTCTEEEKAEILNEFFSQVFTKENTNSIPTLTPRILYIYSERRAEHN